MYLRSLFQIVAEAGDAIALLTREMQGEDELFASSLTLRAIEARLLVMAHALGNFTPVLHERLLEVDWGGWAALHDKLRHGIQPRREEIWYAVNALVPQTLGLLRQLRRREPAWFAIGY